MNGPYDLSERDKPVKRRQRREVSDELKPCPFCGDGGGPGYHSAKCIGTGAFGSAEAWNTRPIESALAARVSELEAQLAALREPGEITDERIEQEIRRSFSLCSAPQVALADDYLIHWTVMAVRHILALDRASRPAPKWVRYNEYNALLSLGWTTVGREYQSAEHDYYFMCPPIPAPTEGEK